LVPNAKIIILGPRISLSFAYSSPDFEDPALRFQSRFGRHNSEQTENNQVEKETSCTSNTVQETKKGKEKSNPKPQNKEENEVTREKTKTKTNKNDQQNNGYSKYCFLPTIEERLCVIATQCWTYKHHVKLQPFLRNILDKIENMSHQTNNCT